jgi:hypothetical protein
MRQASWTRLREIGTAVEQFLNLAVGVVKPGAIMLNQKRKALRRAATSAQQQ